MVFQISSSFMYCKTLEQVTKHLHQVNSVTYINLPHVCIKKILFGDCFEEKKGWNRKVYSSQSESNVLSVMLSSLSNENWED